MQIHLYERLTHKYRSGWSYLDEEAYIGTAKVLAYRKVKDDGTDGKLHITRVIAPSSLGNVDLSHAIASTMSQSHCRHDFDCCGCAFVSAKVSKLSRRQYFVRLFTNYNI